MTSGLSQRPTMTGLSRRRFVEVGLLSWLGLDALALAALRRQSAADETAWGERQRRNACVFVFLFGGPSHIDLWDMKPGAPREIRGEFAPVSTCVPGVQICEHLPALAAQMDKLCLV